MLLEDILTQLGLGNEPQYCFGTDQKPLKTVCVFRQYVRLLC